MQTETISQAPKLVAPSKAGAMAESYSRDVPQALRALAMMARPWSFGNIDQTFRLVFSLAGPQVKAHFDAFAATETGARLLEEKPDMVAALNDRAALAAMPEESFGRAYLRYIDQGGMADASYFATKANMADCAAQFGWSPEVAWYVEREAALHDIFHVLSGYDQSLEGEMGVFQFTAGQYRGLGFLRVLFSPFPLFPVRFKLSPWRRFLSRAYQHGLESEPIGHAELERLLPLPLTEIRRRLSIRAPEEVHPEGMPRGGMFYRFFGAHVVVP